MVDILCFLLCWMPCLRFYMFVILLWISIKESKYHVALQQLQREEQLNLEFANFLHDDILQDLLSVKNMMKKADRPEVQKIITETLDNMNTYIREQMQDYHPTLLPKLTIKENYQNLLDGISQSFPNRLL